MFNIPSFMGFDTAGFGTPIDPDAAAFFARVTAAGGTLSATEESAVNTLVLDMKSYGIWTAMKAVYPMVGASAAACAQNLKSASFPGSFSSGWTFASSGVTGNGTSAYMNTNFIPSTDYTSSTNFGLFLYTSSTTAGSTDRDMGIFTAGDRPSLSLTSKDGTSSKADLFDYTNRISVSGYNVEGFYIGSRTATNSAKLFRNGTSIGTTTASEGTAPSIFLTLGGANLSPSNPISSVGVYSAKTFSFAGTCDGLTDTQASNFYTAVQTFNQTLSRSVGPQIVSDADAQAYINRVYTAGGTLTNTEANAVNQLTIDMKAAGIWTAMKAVYPMVGASAAACAQNLKSSSFTGTFTSGWTFASTGVTPNGTSAYMDTAFNPVTQSSSQTSFYMSVYIRTNSNAGFPYDIGNASDWNTGVKFTGIITRYLTNTRYIAVCDPYSTSNSETDSRGFYSGGTNGSSTQILYKNGSNVLSGTSAQQGFENNNLYISAVNSIVGGASGFSNKENAFASISDGLSSTQAADFYTCVQTFNTTLSRQV